MKIKSKLFLGNSVIALIFLAICVFIIVQTKVTTVLILSVLVGFIVILLVAFYLVKNTQKALFSIANDVEKEKNKSELLARDLEKFRMAVEDASDHIVITDQDGIVIYANKAVQRITGFLPKSIVGKKAGNKETWGGLMDLDFYENLWKTIKKDKKPFIGEVKNKRKNGDPYTVLASISPILDKKGDVVSFVGIERDITKEKQIDQTKTEFVSLASHQLRTPLSAVNWYSEMLLDGDAGELNPKQKDYLEEISKGNKRMVDLVDALLNTSRIDLGTFAIELKEVNIIEIVESVLHEQELLIKDKNITIKKDYSSDLPQSYLADDELLRIIFQNLISNSVKYTKEGGEIVVSINFDKMKLKICIKDDGLGIPSNQQDKIFTKLFRADNVHQVDAGGTGLGLYIVRAIVESVKGKIWFKSKENQGSAFFVELPISGWQKREGTKFLN